MDPLYATVSELERLHERERELVASLHEAASEEARLLDEIAKVDREAVYYDSLAGDMKRDMSPPSLSGLVRSLRW